MAKILLNIPCYNEAERLPAGKILDFLAKNPDISVCLINDGSTDTTAKIIDDTAAKNPSRVSAIHLEKNCGKAEAIRRGMLSHLPANTYEWYGYWDADLATPLEEIDHMLSHASENTKVLMCSRVMRLGSKINRHLHRHILGRIMATLISNVLNLQVYDTQCGAKLIRNTEIEPVFAEKFITEWLFDVEIIARLQKKYPNQHADRYIYEVPVLRWDDVPGSKVKFRHMFQSLAGIIRIYFKYRR